MYFVGMSARSPEPHWVLPQVVVLRPPGQAPALANTCCQGPHGLSPRNTMRPPVKRALSLGSLGVVSNTSESMNFLRPGFQLIPPRGVNRFPTLYMILVADDAPAHQAGADGTPQKYSQLLCRVKSFRAPRIRPKAGTRS